MVTAGSLDATMMLKNIPVTAVLTIQKFKGNIITEMISCGRHITALSKLPKLVTRVRLPSSA